MKTYGLIGYRLSHSFSKKYFTEKFLSEGIIDCEYDNFQIDSIEEFASLIKSSENFKGFNVTIPYKEQIIPYLDALDPAAKAIGAVNVIKMEEDGRLVGYNSDYYGFRETLKDFLSGTGQLISNSNINKGFFITHEALVLGTGGAAKAVVTALKDLGIPYQYVSRTSSEGILSYDQLNEEIIQQHTIIVNTSPLGMYPNVDSYPNIPYRFLSNHHYLYDLVYNPEETVFMKKGKEQGAHVLNGLAMLIGQAEKAWEIWNEK